MFSNLVSRIFIALSAFGLFTFGALAGASASAQAEVIHIASTYSDRFTGKAYHLWVETNSRNQIEKLWVTSQPIAAGQAYAWKNTAKSAHSLSALRRGVDMYRDILPVISMTTQSGFTANDGGLVEMRILENYKRFEYDRLHFWVRKDRSGIWRVYSIQDYGHPDSAAIRSLYFYANPNPADAVGVRRVSGYSQDTPGAKLDDYVFTISILDFDN